MMVTSRDPGALRGYAHLSPAGWQRQGRGHARTAAAPAPGGPTKSTGGRGGWKRIEINLPLRLKLNAWTLVNGDRALVPLYQLPV